MLRTLGIIVDKTQLLGGGGKISKFGHVTQATPN